MNENLLIPWGWHIASASFKNAERWSVKNGKACGCICPECEQPLMAMQGSQKVAHFKHAQESDCQARFESWVHKMAKVVLQEANVVRLPKGEQFAYNTCEIEKKLHGKRPDALLTNASGNQLLVEIRYSNPVDQDKLDVFHRCGARVLEIDLSSTKKNISWPEFREYVLSGANRELLLKDQPQVVKEAEQSFWPWLFAALLILVAAYLICTKKKVYRYV